MRRIFALSVFISLAGSTYAVNDVVNTTTQNTVSQNSTATSAMATQAKDWNLTDAEWAEYLALMHGPAGYYYLQLTPPEVLGYYAKNDMEMRHYAETYVRLEHEKVERELKFDKAFHEAAIRIYADEPIIKPFDVTPYTPIPKNASEHHQALQSGDHLVLFIDIKKNTTVNSLMQLMDRIKTDPSVVLDIYCVNAMDDGEIQQWAKFNQIPVGLVFANRITLNKDDGKFKKIAVGNTLPTVMLVRDGRSKLVNMGAL